MLVELCIYRVELLPTLGHEGRRYGHVLISRTDPGGVRYFISSSQMLLNDRAYHCMKRMHVSAQDLERVRAGELKEARLFFHGEHHP